MTEHIINRDQAADLAHEVEKSITWFDSNNGLMLPGGAKLYKNKQRRFFIGGYASDGSDVEKALRLLDPPRIDALSYPEGVEHYANDGWRVNEPRNVLVSYRGCNGDTGFTTLTYEKAAKIFGGRRKVPKTHAWVYGQRYTLVASVPVSSKKTYVN